MPGIPEKDISFLKMHEEWKAPYMYRKRIEGECELFGATNGVYPNEYKWDTDIILNLRAWTDESGYIKDIDYYKVRDLGGGCGRPQTRKLDLNAADKNIFGSILENSTVSRADKVLPELLERAKSEGLPDGWSVKKCTAASVAFTAPNGEVVSVTKSRILKYLEISHCYIEILTSSDFWDANPKSLKPEDKLPMLALFSLVDISGYYNLESLKDAAEKRQFEVEKNIGYFLLCDACERDDFKAVKKYVLYLDGQKPLITAIMRNNLRIAKFLMQNGAKVYGALKTAMEAGNEAAIKFCKKNYQNSSDHYVTDSIFDTAIKTNRTDIICFLLKNGETYTPDDKINSIGASAISELSKFNGIEWNLNSIIMMYNSGDVEATKRMLNPGIGEKGLHWIISTNDFNLMKSFSKFGEEKSISYSGYFPDSWESLDNRWAKCLTKLLSFHLQYCESVQSMLDSAIWERNIRECKRLMNSFGAVIDAQNLKYAERNRNDGDIWDDTDEKMLRFLIDSCDAEYLFGSYDKKYQWPTTMRRQLNRYGEDPEYYFNKYIIDEVIIKSSKDFCIYLFDKMPEMFASEKRVQKILNACAHRIAKDDVLDIAEERVRSVIDVYDPGNKLKLAMAFYRERLDIIKEFAESPEADNVAWKIEYIKPFYDAGDVETVRLMMRANACDDLLNREKFKCQDATYDWILSIGELELLKYCGELKYRVSAREAFPKKIIENAKEWSKPIKDILVAQSYELAGFLAVYAKQHDVICCKNLIDYFDATISRNVIWACKNEDGSYDESILRLFVDEFDKLQDNICTGELIGNIVKYGSRELCIYLFDAVEDLFTNQKGSLLYYGKNRERNDDIVQIINERLAVMT